MAHGPVPPENSDSEDSETAWSSEDDSCGVEAKEPDAGSTWRTGLAFALVGTSCSWFVVDSLYQLLANEPRVQRGGKMFGTFQAISGYVGLSTAFLYFLYLAVSPYKLSMRGEQGALAMISSTAVLTLVALTLFWDVGAPLYPVVVAACGAGNLVANATFFFAFPLIATYYGGWLIAPVRVGMDFAALATASLAEVQNPTGNYNRFPVRVLFCVYTVLGSLGLASWFFIVRHGIGLLPRGCEASPMSEGSEGETTKAKGGLMSKLAAPWSLLWPILLATACTTAQWGLVTSIGPIAAKMTDPIECGGPDGRWAFRQAVTLNMWMRPGASMLSSALRCPRWLFIIIGVLQLCCAATACSIVAGLHRDVWTSEMGRNAFLGVYALVGALEGYMYTMTYRYIGETPGLTATTRHSASNLFGLLAVGVVNPVSIVVGSLVTAGRIGCVDMVGPA